MTRKQYFRFLNLKVEEMNDYFRSEELSDRAVILKGKVVIIRKYWKDSLIIIKEVKL